MRISDAEITRLAEFKGVSEFEFIQNCTRLRANRAGLALQEKANGECLFLDGNNCAVQNVKPQQCRNFPNLWNFPGLEKTCHAIPRVVSAEEFAQLLKDATGKNSP